VAQISVDVPQITIGYDWPGVQINVTAASPVFPTGVLLRADLKTTTATASPIATLTTVHGLVRIDDYTVGISIPGTITSLLTPGEIMLDIVRTDLTPNQYIGLVITAPVGEPITRSM
jgi:hypothetical protein